jgi:hypothetical protein
MSDWFHTLAASGEVAARAASELDERGFVILPDVVAAGNMERLATAYTEAMTSAAGDDNRVGSRSTKVSPDNGATRFVPGSHRWSTTPEDTMADVRAAHDAEVLACGAAGSLLVGLTPCSSREWLVRSPCN